MSFGSEAATGCAAMACLLNVLESLGHGGFLLDNERRVLAHNSIAVNTLGGGLTLRGKRVAATDRASDRRLQSLIEAALPVGGPEGANWVGVRRDSRLPLLVLIFRLKGDAWAVLNAARLLLVACDPERSQIPPHHMLAEMFGLTPAEAGVAIAITAGRQLAEIAADRGIRIETVRSHSKTVFGKTQTRGQAELAALLTRLAFPAPYGGNGARG
jgi:DNA-binding CsgD family transcriptional regulator